MSRRSKRLVLFLAAGLIFVMFPITPGNADPGESTIPADNPDLTKACGLDVLMILDESGSIASSHATDDVRRAFNAFVDSLTNTGSSMAVIEFSTVARLPSIGGLPGGTYITIDDTTSAQFRSYIQNGYQPNNKTNWEDALRVGRYMAPRPDPLIPHLVVFITDGDPTAVVDNRDVTTTEYHNKVPLSDGETTDASGNAGARPAVPNANGLKATDSHILAIGVGSALQNNQSVDRLEMVSGTDTYDGSGTFDIATTDLYLEENFANLEDALRDAAFQLCAPSVNVRKLYDPTPDNPEVFPDTLDDAVPGEGWEMIGTVLSVPAPGTFQWVLPHPPGPPPAPTVAAPASEDAITNAAGFVTFQWTPTNPDGLSRFQLTEDTQNNPPDPPGGGYENVPTETTCSFRTPDTPDTEFEVGTIDPAGGFTINIPPESIVTCRLVNRAEAAPGIDIEKLTNGVDADDPYGPLIPLDDPVTWTYIVTNTGNNTLVDLLVMDSELGEIVCPDTIPHGDSVTCTATGVAESGLYANTAVATAEDTWGNEVEDTDPSHYYGLVTDIQVVKSTEGDDANDPFGPGIPEGDTVNWTYEVSLPPGATEAVDNVVLFDDAGTPEFVAGVREPGVPGTDDFFPVLVDDGDGDLQLEVGEVWIYEASDAAEAGAYENLATVTATGVTTNTVVIDNDPSHYYGIVSALSIIKYTNGFDANDIDDPDVPLLKTGSAVQWTYLVTNEGNAPVAGWTVTDDMGTPLDTSDDSPAGCPRIVLLPGASATCHLPGTVQEGDYENFGTVSGTDIIGNAIEPDSDPSHYIGVTPAITIQKSTNTEDADAPTGPFVPVGDPVTWDYVVTNNGTADLTNLVVVDSRLVGTGAVSCDDSALPAGTSTNCQATGVAIAGQYHNVALAVADDPFGGKVSAIDPSHYFGAQADITIKKYTNGVDGDEPPGALIPVGGAVEWTYVITNTGNDTLIDIELEDDQLGAVTCPEDTLDSGESMTCTATSTAIRGTYLNTATVTAEDEIGTDVTDSDPSQYLGYLLQIDIEKATNGEDADTPTGPHVPVGDPVIWTYVVTNPGDFFFSEVTVTDDQGVVPVFQGGDTDADTFLDPGEVWTYEATGTAAAGQYENTATVQGRVGEELDNILTDADPSHYFGLVASIDIVKSPDAAVVAIGDPHTFQIAVTNTSNVDLTDVVVTDPIVPACDREIGSMTPGQVVTYDCDVSQVVRSVQNVAFVEGVAPDGSVVSDDDPAAVTVIGSGGTSAIGDLVWVDSNRNQIQDPGEPGIVGARVTIALDTESVEIIPLEIVTMTVTTDSTGHYLATGLVPGEYVVTLDGSSVSGTLTTPGSYPVTLGLGQVMLDADFGVAQVGGLPFTGVVGIGLMILIGAALIGAGWLVVHRVRRSRATV